MEIKDDKDVVMTSEEMLKRTEAIIEEMDRRGISDKQLRKAVKQVREESVVKMQEYEEKLETVGPRASYSKTDKDATFMRMKEDAMNNGQTKPGYNVQIATESLFITNYDIFWQSTDQATLISFLYSFEMRYGRQSAAICADSEYDSEMNYEYLVDNNILPYVKYNMFHQEMTRSMRNDAYLPSNMYYNADEDYYICPMGQRLEYAGEIHDTSDLGYVSTKSVYQATTVMAARCV